MKFSTVNNISTSREMIEKFGGYNHVLRPAENEFYDTKNLTTDYYPIMSPRKKRGTKASCDNTAANKITGMAVVTIFNISQAVTVVAYTHGSKININGTDYEIGLSGTQTRSIIQFGKYLVIFPDKVWVDTETPSSYGTLGNTRNIASSANNITITPCLLSGAAITPTVSATAPADPVNGQYWIDTSATPHVLKVYSSSASSWSTVVTTYIKLAASNIGNGFATGDGVYISGIDTASLYPALASINNATHIIKNLVHSDIIPAGDYIVIQGSVDSVTTISSGTIKFERIIPDMDYVCECGNRLWGCRYGSQNGTNVNEIYASKLGDFKNWNVFEGISTDSYAASVGTDGQFTGAVAYNNNPIFFKEKCMHKVYGDYPSNYQITAVECEGIMKGATNQFNTSAAVVNNVLFYKSRNSVMAYDGSTPTDIGKPLGDTKYMYAAGGGYGNKYYISMSDGTNYHLFAYDTEKGFWIREDNTHVVAFASDQSGLFYADYNTNKIREIPSRTTQDTEDVEWSAETGDIGLSDPDRKYLLNCSIRMSLGVGSVLRISIQYDSLGAFESVTTLNGTSLAMFNIPIRPRRCSHFRLKFEGTGDCKIYSITKTYQDGGSK